MRTDVLRVGLARLAALACLAALSATTAPADSTRPGDFDYYLLTLSWSPNWCALTGDARHDPQCDAGLGLTWTVHGLWPQFDTGYPQDCRTTHRDPTRAETAGMADIMGGAGLAFYEWKKHGRCTGLSASGYFATVRRAYNLVNMPPIFAKITKDLQLPASVIEDAFVESNPALSRKDLTVTCKSGMIQELRICLTKNLAPRACGADVATDCTLPDAELDAVR